MVDDIISAKCRQDGLAKVSITSEVEMEECLTIDEKPNEGLNNFWYIAIESLSFHYDVPQLVAPMMQPPIYLQIVQALVLQNLDRYW